MEWSLRSLHSIDNGAQHFLNNYYDSDDNLSVEASAENQFASSTQSSMSSPSSHGGDDSSAAGVLLQDQTAYEIFKTKDDRPSGQRARDAVWAPMHAPLRQGIVDGRPVVFELRTAVNQKPTVSRQERLDRRHLQVHAQRSTWEVRTRLWLMHFTLASLSAVFLAIFVSMNVSFALIFYFLADDGCCDDRTMSFADVFAFCVQTSTTIGYGGFTPSGMLSNFLVVLLSYTSTLMNTVFAGLFFTKFVTPVINVQCSDVMTLCNVNGVPCLSLRIGNADGRYLNPLTDINVRLTYAYQIPYTDHAGEQRYFAQSEELKLLCNRQHDLAQVWTLRHVLDESSPLFGLHLEEHPANKIYVFTLSVDAVQHLTKSAVNVQTEYALEDIMIGYNFQNQVTYDEDAKVATTDFAKLSVTEPYPVWYPARTGAYDTSARVAVKIFKP